MSKKIGTHHMKAFSFIEKLIKKYGEAFPSIPTLAKVAGCSERYMTAVIKDLTEWGYLKKIPRFSLSRQLSNGYEIIAPIEEEVAVNEPAKEAPVKTVHPIKDSIKALTKPFIKKDDDTPSDTRVQSEYQMLFLQDAVEELGVDTAREIFPYAKPMIDTTKPMAWFNAIRQLKAFFHEAHCIGPYFKSILKNEIIKHKLSNVVMHEKKKAHSPLKYQMV